MTLTMIVPRNLEVALNLAAGGLVIIPCRPDKRPYAADWPNAATTDPSVISNWWERWPDAVPGLPCGPNGFLVVDQDRHDDGADGVSAWERLCAQNGVDEALCLVVATPSGGRHTYFMQGEGERLRSSAGKIAAGIDTRGDGGYVIAPGAVLPDGRLYRVLSGSPATSPPIPADLRAFLASKPKAAPPGVPTGHAEPTPADGDARLPNAREAAYVAKALGEECDKVRCAPNGQRNETFNRAVFAIATLIANYGVGLEDMRALKVAAHSVGLEPDEIEATFNSAMLAGLAQPRPPIGDKDFPAVNLAGVTVGGAAMTWDAKPPAPKNASTFGDRAVMRRVSDVAAEPVHWLWPSRVAIGKLTIIAGDPGLGKSQLTAFMAAKVTTGAAWPNQDGISPFGNVIMLSCEDDIADTIRPRLEAAGAALDRVHVIEAVRTGAGQMRGFSLTQDLAELECALDAVGDVRLVVVDPITAYLAGSDTHKTGDVRAALAPLQELAARRRIAVVAVSHFNKSAGNGKSINAVTGSGAFVAASRATFIVAKDNDNPDRRLLIEAKNNLAQAPGLAFTVEGKLLPNGINAPHVVFEDGTVELTADQAIGEPNQHRDRSPSDEAADFLRVVLADGALPAKQVLADAKEAGISEKTLRRTLKKIGVIPRKDGFQGEWVWGFGLSPNRVSELFAANPGASAPAKDAQDGQPSTSENMGIIGSGWPSLSAN